MQTYDVTVQRLDDAHAEARVRSFRLATGVRRGDPSMGPNAVETLLSALGTCLLTNVNTLMEQMRVSIQDGRVELQAERQDKPPLLTHITCRLVLVSAEPQSRLETLFGLAQKWGTVTNTLARSVPLDMQLQVRTPDEAESQSAGQEDAFTKGGS
jgi:putative redox protein